MSGQDEKFAIISDASVKYFRLNSLLKRSPSAKLPLELTQEMENYNGQGAWYASEQFLTVLSKNWKKVEMPKMYKEELERIANWDSIAEAFGLYKLDEESETQLNVDYIIYNAEEAAERKQAIQRITSKTKNDSFKRNKSEKEGGIFTLAPEDVREVLAGILKKKYFGRADTVIQRITNSSNVNIDSIPQIVRAFMKCYDDYAEGLTAFGKSFLLSVITLARYELEVAVGSYVGGFILPDSVIQDLPEGKYLEVALGSGDNLEKLATVKPQSSFYGCDLSAGMVERSKRSLKERAQIRRGDAMDLPYPARDFDVVVMLNALDRIPNPQQALQEVSRVLKPEGQFVVGNCNPLQYIKETDGGLSLVYVAEPFRVRDMPEALSKAGCSLDLLLERIPWNIKTVLDGDEALSVDLAIGKKQEK